MDYCTKLIGEKLGGRQTSQTSQKRLRRNALCGVGGVGGGLHLSDIGAGVCGCRLLFQIKFRKFHGSKKNSAASPKGLSTCRLAAVLPWN